MGGLWLFYCRGVASFTAGWAELAGGTTLFLGRTWSWVSLQKTAEKDWICSNHDGIDDGFPIVSRFLTFTVASKKNPKSEIKENPSEIIVHHINLFYSGGLCSISLFVFSLGDGAFQPPSFPGLVIGGDALGPALKKLLGEESQCVAAGTDRAVVKMDPPETSLDGLKQKHMDFLFPKKMCFCHTDSWIDTWMV